MESREAARPVDEPYVSIGGIPVRRTRADFGLERASNDSAPAAAMEWRAALKPVMLDAMDARE
jgi:hypothetical protein